MDFKFTEAQERLRAEVRAFILQERTPELVDEVEWQQIIGPVTRRFLQKLGARGWLAPSWPKHYGGVEASHTDELIIAEELSYYSVRPNSVGAAMAGPTLLHFGSQEQKEFYLPQISRGDIEFALGYTEPQAGSDLAALDIRAVEDGDDWVINGSKLFNTNCHFADFHWLGARTDPQAPKHKGISLIIVDLKSPGITLRPLWTMAGFRTNEVFYDNVRVPKTNLVGTRGRGFQQIAMALDLERMFPVGPVQWRFDRLLDHVKKTPSLAEDELVRRHLAELAAEVEVCRLLSYRLAWMQDRGQSPNHEASMLKLVYSELRQHLSHASMKILGPFGQLTRESKWVLLDGEVEFHHRFSVLATISAGSSEIQRNIIAQRGLGLPRA